ncbi:MAG: hypothetical protein LBQ28_04385, partial [Prevotellaceae bacterium]|nr:hypothetical protein [Prevotellaceae bacterium]
FIRPHNTLCKNPDKTRTTRTPALVAGIIKQNWTIADAFKPTKKINKNMTLANSRCHLLPPFIFPVAK